LETLKPKSTDNSSFWRRADLSKTPSWEQGGTIPNSLDFSKTITERKFETLTVARLGDWFGAMQPIRYPVQVIDAMRDVILNVAWQYFQPHMPVSLLDTGQHLWNMAFMELAGYPFNGYLSDDYLSQAKIQYFQRLGINPTAWATRSARTQVITSATRTVVICQQMLVDWLQNSDTQYQAVVKRLNDDVSLAGEKAWTGSVWPFGTCPPACYTAHSSDLITCRPYDSACTCAHQHEPFRNARPGFWSSKL
jgi:hypothetical protein